MENIEKNKEERYILCYETTATGIRKDRGIATLDQKEKIHKERPEMRYEEIDEEELLRYYIDWFDSEATINDAIEYAKSQYDMTAMWED